VPLAATSVNAFLRMYVSLDVLPFVGIAGVVLWGQ
jgi:hypothetical protein